MSCYAIFQRQLVWLQIVIKQTVEGEYKGITIAVKTWTFSCNYVAVWVVSDSNILNPLNNIIIDKDTIPN